MDNTNRPAAAIASSRVSGPLVHVRTLGRFGVLVEGAPLRFGRKAPRKPLALLEAIVAMGSPAVCRHRLIDALWPDSEADAACNALDVALLRLRRLLGGSVTVLQREGRIALNPACCAVDAQQFERLALAPCPHDGAALLRVLFSLYRGAFLPDEQAAWAIPARERLRDIFVRVVVDHAGRLERRGDWHDVLQLFQRAMAADEGSEAFQRGVMRASLRLGRELEAVAVRQRLRHMREETAGGFQSVGYR